MRYFLTIHRYFHKLIFKKGNKNKNFTIISQNCLGGVLYHLLGIEFLSPTINMFIEDENFVKLVENFEYYMGLEPEPICELYTEPFDENVKYPKIKVGDIELCCLHYESCAHAIEKWNDRRKRVNFENVYVIANTWNLHNNEELIRRIIDCPYKKVIFSDQEYSFDECIKLRGGYWSKDVRGIVRPNITDRKDGVRYYFEDQFDFVKWLNQQN